MMCVSKKMPPAHGTARASQAMQDVCFFVIMTFYCRAFCPTSACMPILLPIFLFAHSLPTTMVKQYADRRRASSIALQHNEERKPKTASDFVKFSKAVIEFQMLALQSELQLLEELSGMSDDEKLAALFAMLDQDGNGVLNAGELAQGLSTIGGEESFEENMEAAVKSIAAFDSNKDQVLDQSEFSNLIKSLAPVIGCSLQELSEMLVMKVLFSEERIASYDVPVKSQDDSVETKDVALTEKPKIDPSLRRAMKDRRMKALFNVFDQSGEGVVDFKEVVVGMYKIMENMDEASHAAVAALLLFDEKQTRELSYKDFARLILNVVASSPDNVTFNDVADTLTRNAINVSSGITSDYVMKKLRLDAESKLLLDISDDEEFSNLDVVELAKMDRLFKVFDTNGDGFIDLSHLILGLRKFHATTGMKTTVEEATKVMKTFDKSANGKLNKEEFASFIVNFASTANVELVDMVDFMIVIGSVYDNTDAELEYLKSIGVGGEEKIDYWYG